MKLTKKEVEFKKSILKLKAEVKRNKIAKMAFKNRLAMAKKT